MQITASNGKTYEIENGTATCLATGKTYRVTKCETDIPAHIRKALKGTPVPDGYVWGGSVLLPREVAEAALASTPDDIDGLEELRAARAAYHAASDAYSRAIEYGAAHIPEPPSHIQVDAISEQYPRAAAYMLADDYAHSYNADKAAAGNRALKAIERGDDASEAIAKMIYEWDNAASNVFWNA